MRWIVPTDPNATRGILEKRLGDTADQFRTNSGLWPQEYSGPTIGLIYMRFTERLRRRSHGYELCSE